MRKIIFLIVSVCILSISLIGCSKPPKTPSENSIPFLTFSVNQNQKENCVEAYLNYWDLANGKIIHIDNAFYRVNKGPARTDKPGYFDWGSVISYDALPLSWDGGSYIYLESNLHTPENIPDYFKVKMFNGSEGSYYSKNLQVELRDFKNVNYLKMPYGDFTFRIFDDYGKIVMEKNIKISLYNDVFHGGNSGGETYFYEKDSKEVKGLYLYYDTKGGHLLICEINLEKGTYEWHDVKDAEGCIPNMNQLDVSIIGNNFIVPMCGCSLGTVDADNYTCKFLDQQDIFKSLSFYNSKIYCGGYPQIPGEYKDFLILNGTIDYGNTGDGTLSENYRHLWIAYNTRSNDIAGILEWNHLEPQFFVVKDKNGKELSRIKSNVLIKDSDKTYDIDGEPYINGYFLFVNCIKFPHKNGG